MRAKLLFVLALAVGVVLVNVGFTAYLMFLSGHDLKLLLLLLLFSLGIAGFFALAVSTAFASRLRTLLDFVRRVGAGDLSARVDASGSDEIAQLGTAFNGMTERLEAAFQRQDDLEQARRHLVAAVSHDLRTPLATMKAVIESIEDGVVSDAETVRRYLRTVQAEISYLSQLIDDLFELSQIDSGVLELRLEPSNIGDLVSDTLVALSAQAQQKRLTLKGEVDEALPAVAIDSSRMQRVLFNLVQNALRHTPADGTILVRARDTGPELQVIVEDTGEGIDPEELPRVFERFHRGNRARSRDDGGSGLGLSIARGIVELHGGRIWAESALGQGSTFTFALPK